MKEKKKRLKYCVKSKISLIIIYAMILSLGFESIAFGATLSVFDQNRMMGANAIEWQSSNLREWINSDKTTVDYTALPPSYKNEAGFLSNNNFTQAEQDAIAITRHAGSYTYVSSNINNTLYLSQRSVARNDYVYNDKVFILNFSDLVKYIEKNKQLLNSNKKYYSNYLKKQTNKQDKYDYIVNGGYVGGYWLNEATMYTATLGTTASRSVNNIVPALSLKPDYVLSNGIVAKNLPLGSTVTFGKYNGEVIEWQVINKFDNGSPLLWSTKIITTKEYDMSGDLNPNTSNYINYSTYDTDLVTGNGQSKSWETGTTIVSSPVISFDNESELTTPTNNTSITLKIRVTDPQNSIRKIILPNGTIVNNNYVEWTITQNGEYDIITENSQGVISVRHIVTNAINTPAEVTITTNKDSSTKWTNKPVNVTVSASNNGVYTRTAYANKNMGYNSLSTSGFPTWMSLGGKRLRVTGTLKNALSDADYQNINPDTYIYIKMSEKWYTNNQIAWSWPNITGVSLRELKEKGQINIDYTYTLPSNIYECISLYLELSNGSLSKVSPYNYWASDFTFEILDKDDLTITQINLPDGNVVNDDHVTYTIFKNGSYTFSALDNRGKTTSKTIDLAIDTVAPSVDISGIQTNYVSAETIHISSTDDLSGVKSIKLPNGEYRTTTAEGQPLSVDYNIVANGSYTFEALDYAGNKFSRTIIISNIDTVAPTATITQNPSNWTSGDVTINVVGQDTGGSGVKEIKLPNGSIVNGSTYNYKVSSNGEYSFQVTDNVGNITVKSITISNIDITPPTLTVTKPSSWTNSSITITATAVDSGSGVKHIKLPNGNIVLGSSATFVVSEVGVYYFSAVDNVGNTSSSYVIVDNIERNKPSVNITNNQNWNNSSGVPVVITGEDN